MKPQTEKIKSLSVFAFSDLFGFEQSRIEKCLELFSNCEDSILLSFFDVDQKKTKIHVYFLVDSEKKLSDLVKIRLRFRKFFSKFLNLDQKTKKISIKFYRINIIRDLELINHFRREKFLAFDRHRVVAFFDQSEEFFRLISRKTFH